MFAADYYIAKSNISAAMEHLAAAQPGACSVTRRECLYHGAFTAWLSGKASLAFQMFVEISTEFPQDLYAVKRGQLLAFLLGSPRDMLSIIQAPAVQAACHNRTFYGGMVSFALEQNGYLQESAAAALGSADPAFDPFVLTQVWCGSQEQIFIVLFDFVGILRNY